MKNLIFPLIGGLVMSCAFSGSDAQEFKEKVSREFTLNQEASRSVLSVYNIFGSVRVEGYSGNKVIFEVEKTISAKDNAALETGKKEFRMEMVQHDDSIIAYIAEPHDSRPDRGWRKNEKDIDYSYNLNFTVKVPVGINVNVSTINDGNILVTEVAGLLNVRNVNGSVTLDNVKGTTDAGTVNGDIEIQYDSNPPGQSSYNTINGNITVDFKPDLSADMQFKSMNGDFYTDFPDVKSLPATTVKNQEDEGEGTVYKLEKITTIRFGAGGKLFRFETLNGNVYIKKQS